jgi:hypothetical protein
LARGVPRQGVMVEGVKGVKNAPCRPKCMKTAKKKGSFLNFLAYKLPKTPFFAQKYLTGYTPETFLRNTSILKIFVT